MFRQESVRAFERKIRSMPMGEIKRAGRQCGGAFVEDKSRSVKRPRVSLHQNAVREKPFLSADGVARPQREVYPSSRLLSASLTRAGLALPFIRRMTCPTKKAASLVFPPR